MLLAVVALAASCGGAPEPEATSNFIRIIINEDNKTGKFGGKVHTRFPPEDAEVHRLRAPFPRGGGAERAHPFCERAHAQFARRAHA